MRKRQITVIGSSGKTAAYEEAKTIGSFIARRNWILITGGRGGVMEAASRGAAESGGIVIGIHPGDDLQAANPYCTVVIPTGMGFARNVINILSADAVVSIEGGYGTLSELAYAMVFGKPVICCEFTGGWSNGFPRAAQREASAGILFTASSVEEACRLLDEIVS